VIQKAFNRDGILYAHFENNFVPDNGQIFTFATHSSSSGQFKASHGNYLDSYVPSPSLSPSLSSFLLFHIPSFHFLFLIPKNLIHSCRTINKVHPHYSDLITTFSFGSASSVAISFFVILVCALVAL
jgi:hypothetical protein